MAKQAGDRVAGYELLRCIGHGANGAVYLARTTLPDGSVGHVALKLLPLPPQAGSEAQASFLRSVELARRLLHPGIVATHAAGIEGDLAWLAMEPVPGSDLLRYTQASRLLPEAQVAQLGARIARALAHAHHLGIVHRDIKPANVLVDWRSGAVKLTDFGLARAEDSARTGTGIVPGSPAYMAPELLAGALPTPRSDLYALGATLYQLLTGSLPHPGYSMGELLRRVALEEAPDPCVARPEVSAAMGRLVQRLLAKRPSDRPADADEAARMLDEVADLCAGPRP